MDGKAEGESDRDSRARAPSVPSDRASEARSLEPADASAPSDGASGREAPEPAARRSLEPVVLRPDDPAFPLELLRVRPHPKLLYALGELAVLRQPMVAIVGSREPTTYGIKVAYEAAYEAARAGLVVVSGMARGLDARAHRGALDAGGKTVGVLGCGLDQRYPRENWDLLEAVPHQGCLITEYELGTRPTHFTFPARNRLIAGLARCVLVVEGRAKGGTSNTVWWMQNLSKAIFAVPGRIDEPMAEGPNLLIQQGARIYLSPRDLLAEYKIAWTGAAPDGSATGMGAPGAEVARAELSGAEATVFDVITPQPVHVDCIAQCTQLDAGLLLAALSSLELQGLIRQLPGKHFALAS